MHRGYLALWRKFRDHDFWKEKRVFSKAEAWIDILWEAQHNKEPSQVVIGMKVFDCNYGESLKSIRTWAKRWGWSHPKAQKFIKLLKSMRQIDTVSETVTTRITVLNYKEYDPRNSKRDTQAFHKRSTSVPQAFHDCYTDKNVKNVKNVKNKEKEKEKEKNLFPLWLDKKLWSEYKKHRQKLKAPMTDYAEKLAISKLLKLTTGGDDPALIIQQSIDSGWKGLFPLKDDLQKSNIIKPNTYAQAQDAERRERAAWLRKEMENEKTDKTADSERTPEIINKLPKPQI